MYVMQTMDNSTSEYTKSKKMQKKEETATSAMIHWEAYYIVIDHETMRFMKTMCVYCV